MARLSISRMRTVVVYFALQPAGTAGRHGSRVSGGRLLPHQVGLHLWNTFKRLRSSDTADMEGTAEEHLIMLLQRGHNPVYGYWHQPGSHRSPWRLPRA
jgi:hypothetical protein